MADFKERLNRALRIRHLSPAELSRLSGVTEGAISQYRMGAYKASQRSLKKLARALRVSIPWLMGGDVPMEEGAPTLREQVGLPLDGTVEEMVEAMHKNPKLGVLFSSSAKLRPEDLDAIVSIVQRMNQEEGIE